MSSRCELLECAGPVRYRNCQDTCDEAGGKMKPIISKDMQILGQAVAGIRK